jgi:integrase
LNVHGKGQSTKGESTVKISPRIWPEIKAYIAEIGGKGLLFTGTSRNREYNRKEKAISPTRVYFLFQKYAEMAGIDPEAFSPHSARATFITLCLKAGADIYAVMRASRHTTPEATIKYDRARMTLSDYPSDRLPLLERPGR